MYPFTLRPYLALLVFIVFTGNLLHTFAVPVEDPTLREMAEYMEANR